MPKVGDKEFAYDEEGIAAAEAEAAKTEEPSPNDSFMEAVTAGLAEADKAPAEPAEGEIPQEAINQLLDAGEQAVTEEAAAQGDVSDVPIRLFNELFGDRYNPEDVDHQEQMEQIQEVLDDNPGLLDKLSLPRDHPDRVTDSEFAMMFFRGLEPEEQNA